jgi:hypothetical protein
LCKGYREQTVLAPELWNALLQDQPFNLKSPCHIMKTYNLLETTHPIHLLLPHHHNYDDNNKRFVSCEEDGNNYNLHQKRSDFLNKKSSTTISSSSSSSSSPPPSEVVDMICEDIMDIVVEEEEEKEWRQHQQQEQGDEKMQQHGELDGWKHVVRPLHLKLARAIYKLLGKEKNTIETMETLMSTVRYCPQVEVYVFFQNAVQITTFSLSVENLYIFYKIISYGISFFLLWVTIQNNK